MRPMGFQKTAALWLSVYLIATSFPVLADSVWIPRLGYLPTDTKRVYLDITIPEARKSDENIRRELQKTLKKQAKEASQAKETSEAIPPLKEGPLTEGASLESLPGEVSETGENEHATEQETLSQQKPDKDAEASDPSKVSKEQARQQKEADKAARKAARKLAKAEEQKRKEAERTARQAPKAKDTVEAEPTTVSEASAEKKEEPVESKPDPEKLAKLELRKKREAERIARQKERFAALEAKRAGAPVNGDLFLFNLKMNRLLYKDSPQLQVTDMEQAPHVGSYYVDFAADMPEGVYDVAIRGSGHRTEQPFRVSNTIYWDALHIVLQDFQKAHCPRIPGKHVILQQCYQLSVMNETEETSSLLTLPRLIDGGWYTDNPMLKTQGVLKSTVEIATMSQLLMHFYMLNPTSYEYLRLNSTNTVESPYPDLLDEINWGLQYLLSVQQEDGGFAADLRNVGVTGKPKYRLGPENTDDTAKAVAALASASQAFKTQDLGLSVKFLRAAEKGWSYLLAHRMAVSEENLLLASHALQKASPGPQYVTMLDALKGTLKEISPQTALLLGESLPDFEVCSAAVEETSVSPSSTIWSHVSDVVQLQQTETKDPAQLSQWLTELFGYDEVSLVRDPKLEQVTAWVDPLQWLATKTGEVATRLAYRIEDEGLMRSSETLDSEFLKKLEEKEHKAAMRIRTGYDKLSLSTPDKALLAYTLGLLNLKAASEQEKAEAQKPKFDRHAEPVMPVRGFYPKEI